MALKGRGWRYNISRGDDVEEEDVEDVEDGEDGEEEGLKTMGDGGDDGYGGGALGVFFQGAGEERRRGEGFT